MKNTKILFASVALSIFLAVPVLFFVFTGNNPAGVPTENELVGVFNKIYTDGTWGRDAMNRSISGSGSTIEITDGYRRFLEYFIEKYRISSVVDAGCGDWNFSRKINWHGARYLGIDISTTVIEQTRKNYESNHVKFRVGDITEDLPPADLLICKDVLQHLPNRLILKFIQNNLRKGKYRWAIITNDIHNMPFTENIPAGKYRKINLSAPPFNVKGLSSLPIRFGYETSKTVQVLKLEGDFPHKIWWFLVSLVKS